MGNSRKSVRLYFGGGSKITADGDCSHEIKRRLLLGRKVMTNLTYSKAETLLCQQRSIYGQGYGFSSGHVWMWELDCEEGERWRIDAFELWCWRRLLRVPWTARRSNQSILKEISPGCSELISSIINQSVSSAAQSCLPLCDPMGWRIPDFSVHHQLPELTQTHVHRVNDAIQPSHPLLAPCPPAFNLSQHQGLFQWVSSSHQVAKVLEC